MVVYHMASSYCNVCTVQSNHWHVVTDKGCSLTHQKVEGCFVACGVNNRQSQYVAGRRPAPPFFLQLAWEGEAHYHEQLTG